MKVICIDKDAKPERWEGEWFPTNIDNGRIYNVSYCYMEDGFIFYGIDEDDEYDYWESCFVRCYGIDEYEINKKGKP